MPPRPPKRKDCYFSKNKVSYIDYKDVALLRKFMSDRGKIRSRRVTGTLPQYQKLLAEAIKNAREMALLPYTTR
ncbi:MAG: 30S ribosomal protein S18 [Euzebyales bacterium]|jgi:ribosomal protein S18|nr:30S ribosomal protein S18 [Euzebyales bacterium]